MNIKIHDSVKRPWGWETQVTVSEGYLSYTVTCDHDPSDIDGINAKAANWIQAQLARLQDEAELQQYVGMPKPLDIVRAAHTYLQETLDNLSDMHATLKALNLYGTTDNDTEAAVNSAQDTRAVAVRNALIAYRDGWVGQFDTKQSDAMANPNGWRMALKTFVANMLGNLRWMRNK